ncbi:YkoF family thiamine/hydroxymethylpyrimidine-binding protein [uncultured Ferrimonas sp.]|uniref:YkoF family thiamine/hydroxymethylpyrimidine-binding protein n=1 Tax=uncultured Ferrimonas sp. TaxID=432640 RepID=UPI0026398FE8|nr:YkoF family thiamine/hydroxymethylpyrimidine-binding protein [uncultured Ferrimonas sp.]
MQLSVEISLYPLKDNYLEVIQWFIERLKAYPQIQRHTNGMSTQLGGDYDQVMALLAKEMKAAHEQWGKEVFVCKFITGGVNLDHSE